MCHPNAAETEQLFMLAVKAAALHTQRDYDGLEETRQAAQAAEKRLFAYVTMLRDKERRDIPDHALRRIQDVARQQAST